MKKKELKYLLTMAVNYGKMADKLEAAQSERDATKRQLEFCRTNLQRAVSPTQDTKPTPQES